MGECFSSIFVGFLVLAAKGEAIYLLRVCTFQEKLWVAAIAPLSIGLQCSVYFALVIYRVTNSVAAYKWDILYS